MNRIVKKIIATALAAITLTSTMVSASAYKLTDFKRATLVADYSFKSKNVPEITVDDLIGGKTIVFNSIKGNLTDGKQILLIKPNPNLSVASNKRLVKEWLGDLKLLDANRNELLNGKNIIEGQWTWDEDGNQDGGLRVFVGNNSRIAYANVSNTITKSNSNGTVTITASFSADGLIVSNPALELRDRKTGEIFCGVPTRRTYSASGNRTTFEYTAEVLARDTKHDYATYINGIQRNKSVVDAVPVILTFKYAPLYNQLNWISGPEVKHDQPAKLFTMYGYTKGKTLNLYVTRPNSDDRTAMILCLGEPLPRNQYLGLNTLMEYGYLGDPDYNSIDTIDFYDINDPTVCYFSVSNPGFTGQQWYDFIFKYPSTVS